MNSSINPPPSSRMLSQFRLVIDRASILPDKSEGYTQVSVLQHTPINGAYRLDLASKLSVLVSIVITLA